MTEILRIDGLYDSDGNPAYATKAQNVLVVNAPEELRKKQ
jgi:hypothetical protein